MNTEMVPFGKYKGRPVEDMLADQDYMTWLGAQPWFRERFGHLIDAHDKSEAEATPVHNRLQALFLDKSYQAAFASIALEGDVEGAVTREKANRAAIRAKVEKAMADLSEVPQFPYAVKERNERIQGGERVLAELEQLPAPAAGIRVSFEAPQDVVLTVDVPRAQIWGKYMGSVLDGITLEVSQETVAFCRLLTVEIKPFIGDDYPVVLRQMRRNGSQFLFIGRYEGVGVTEEQFVEMFKASGRQVIFKRDVDAAVGR